jgi:hypothetical protein
MAGTAPGDPNEPRIIVYGHRKSEFSNPSALTHYITSGIVQNRRRYRYTQRKRADIIILSLEGVALGHFEVSDRTTPDDQDLSEYPSARCVYIVGARAVYCTPVRLISLGIKVNQFGTPILVAQFDRIKQEADRIQEFP